MRVTQPGPSTDVLTPHERSAVPLKLVVVDGPDLGREFPVPMGTLILGKSRGCDLTLGDTSVSGRHLAIEARPDVLRLQDLDSTNGSFVNEQRFSSVEVRSGSEIRVGRTTLKVLPQAEFSGRPAPSPQTSFGGLTGTSVAMREVFTLLERASASDTNLLLQGESGTGKERCARAIHLASERRDQPFVVADLCSAQPSLLESELFGHRAGAFTGASQTRIGAFEQANRGTLFLDEVGELPLEAQARLLRVLEEREVKPIGASGYRKVDVRIICSSHRDLAAEVTAQRFRADLFHRVAVVTVCLPPLRERLEDVAFLVKEFLAEMGAPAHALAPHVLELLRAYHWPGNVRELKNVIQRTLIVGETSLPSVELRRLQHSEPARQGPQEFHQAKQRLVDLFEADYLKRLLVEHRGNLLQASRASGIARPHLYRLLKKHQLQPDRGGRTAEDPS